MSAKKKRRQLPEEDLAAAVAEIINSPITRSNLSFLRPLPASASTETEQLASKPMGVELRPMGVNTAPMGLTPQPMGADPVQATDESLLLVSEELPAPEVLEGIPASDAQTPMGFELSPMGFDITPAGLPSLGAPIQPPLPFPAHPIV